MDLEVIGRKILEALAIQGKIAALETELASLSGGLVDASSRIQDATFRKEEANEFKRDVDLSLADAITDEKEAEAEVQDANDALIVAKEYTRKMQKEVERFGEATFEQLDSAIKSCERDKAIIEDAKVKVIEELDSTRKDFESRQKEIEGLGYSLDVVKPSHRPKTTVL